MIIENYYKYIVLLVGIVVGFGNFFPSVPTWGFDRYVIGLPFAHKSVVGFLLIAVVATFPFLHGKTKLYDDFYACVAIFAFSFLFLRGYFVFRDMLLGIDPYKAYFDATGEEYRTSSVFFPYGSRLAILSCFCLYLLYSLRLSAFSWREIGFLSGAVIASVLLSIDFLRP
jgi:hypothetical protein